jgi:hypothetical protein
MATLGLFVDTQGKTALHLMTISLSMGECNSTVILLKRNLCVGSIPHESKFIPITDNWIRPAPRATGLRQKRQCDVPFSYRERQKKKKNHAGQCCQLWIRYRPHTQIFGTMLDPQFSWELDIVLALSWVVWIVASWLIYPNLKLTTLPQSDY